MRPDLIVFGIALIIIGLSILTISSYGGNAEYGGIILIGPFPIVFASSPDMAVLSLMAGVIMILLVMFFRMR
jgi:uncharacterized protein (TIGR00304 family)